MEQDHQKKMAQIMQRFKNRKELYKYLDDRLGIWLPACKYNIIILTVTSYSPVLPTGAFAADPQRVEEGVDEG